MYVPEKCADAKAVYDTVSGACEMVRFCPPTLTQKVIGEL